MELISPLQLYFILKLDNIGTLFTTISIITLILSVVSFFFLGGAASAGEKNTGLTPSDMDGWLKINVVGVVIGLFFAFASTFLPSTKQMAAIVVVPKIVNNPSVQHDAGEIYQLAKTEMESILTPKKETK